MRGKRLVLHRPLRQRGITPAGAGKTKLPCSSVSARRDHPRRCGENKDPSLHVYAHGGSPPQVRGKPKFYTAAQAPPRITPAGAGKTCGAAAAAAAVADHPRRCGENSRAHRDRPRWTGSPPQVRGKRQQHQTHTHPRRITPAGAGKTDYDGSGTNIYRDHPRRCGENLVAADKRTLDVGSPPQVRGKLAVFTADFYCVRITPAGAGKTERV